MKNVTQGKEIGGRMSNFENLKKWQAQNKCIDERISKAIGKKKDWLTQVKERNSKVKISDLEKISKFTGINLFDLNNDFRVERSYLVIKYKKGKGFTPVRLLTTKGAENFAKSCGFNRINTYLYNLERGRFLGKYEMLENFD